MNEIEFTLRKITNSLCIKGVIMTKNVINGIVEGMDLCENELIFHSKVFESHTRLSIFYFNRLICKNK